MSLNQPYAGRNAYQPSNGGNEGAPMRTLSVFAPEESRKQLLTSLSSSLPTPSSVEQLDSLYLSSPQMHEIDSILLDEALEIGMPFSFKFEQNGVTVQNIFPILSMADQQISSSSASQLLMHTETAFHPKRPDFVFLYCLRSDPSAGTTVAHLGKILSLLDKETKAILKKKEFSISPDLSFLMAGAPDAPSTVSILNAAETEFSYDSELITPLSPRAEAALAKLDEAIAASTETIILDQHQILLIPNKQYVHGRTPFTPRFDGSDRWLKRIMLHSFADAKKNSHDYLGPIE